MDYINNKKRENRVFGRCHFERQEHSINRLNDVTTVTVRNRNTGKVTSETFSGDAPSPGTSRSRISQFWHQ